MNLHKDTEAFNSLSAITSEYIGIPISAIKRNVKSYIKDKNF